MNRYQEGFALFLKHQGVVHYAIARLGISRWQSQYEDLVQEGILIYVRYYVRYKEPLDSPAAVQKFNRLAGKFVYLNLLAGLRQQGRRGQIEAKLRPESQASVAPLDKVATAKLLLELKAVVSPREWQVLRMRFDQQLTDKQIGEHLGISRQAVGKIRRRLQQRYRELNED